MKNIILRGLIAVALLAPQFGRAQGTVYVSNLGEPSTDSIPIANDSWMGVGFLTGKNPDGYVLNSVQLGMSDATGNPNNFTVTLCAQSSFGGATLPGNSIGSLSGLDPATDGIYSYTSATSITLLPNKFYFIALAAGTPSSIGSYAWDLSNTASEVTSGGWGSYDFFYYSSRGGLPWGFGDDFRPLFAINATAVPEPSSLGLLIFGGLAYGWKRASRKGRKSL